MEPWKKSQAQGKYVAGQETGGALSPKKPDGASGTWSPLVSGVKYETGADKFDAKKSTKGTFAPQDATNPFSDKTTMPSSQKKYAGKGTSRSPFDPFTGPKLD